MASVSASPQSYGGIPVAFGPLMSLPPSFATGIADLTTALPSPESVTVAEGAALLVRNIMIAVSHALFNRLLKLRVIELAELVR